MTNTCFSVIYNNDNTKEVINNNTINILRLLLISNLYTVYIVVRQQTMWKKVKIPFDITFVFDNINNIIVLTKTVYCNM